MNVGDYVRTKNKIFQPSQIARIRRMQKDSGYKDQYYIELDHNLMTDYEFHIYEEDVIKSSPNIIDLLEVGDYVNGLKVIQMYSPEGKYTLWIKLSDNTFIDNSKDIKSIVTKEMFTNAEYRVETN